MLRRRRKAVDAKPLKEKKLPTQMDFEQGVSHPMKKIKHYDVDVLTKVGVYSGIGWIAFFGY